MNKIHKYTCLYRMIFFIKRLFIITHHLPRTSCCDYAGIMRSLFNGSMYIHNCNTVNLLHRRGFLQFVLKSKLMCICFVTAAHKVLWIFSLMDYTLLQDSLHELLPYSSGRCIILYTNLDYIFQACTEGNVLHFNDIKRN